MPESIIEDLGSGKRKSYCHIICYKSEWKAKEEPTLHPTFDSSALMGFKRTTPIDPELLLTNPKLCVICGADFKTRTALHSHLTKQQHRFNRLDPVTSTFEYECRNCENILSMNHLTKHSCYIKQQELFVHRIKSIHRDGSALVCILCRGRLLPSRVHLIIHLIMVHSLYRDPFRCMFCGTKFLSENVMMQETHAFECHAPVLFLAVRKACYNMIRNEQGYLADPSTPFICFYDTLKLEGRTYADMLEGQQSGQAAKDLKPHTICTASFSNLAEFTVHVLCFHGAVSKSISSFDEPYDLVEETRIMQNQSTKIPGPSVRELLRIQNAVYQSNKGGLDEESSSLFWKSSFRSSLSKFPFASKEQVLPDKLRYTGFVNRTKQCRMCLEMFQDNNKLVQHVMTVHRIEAKTRLEHLLEKNQLANQLDLDTFCSECHRIFPNNFTLQVHMAVSHAGKDWRHCGLCNYEFFSEVGGVPQHLILFTHEASNKANNRNEPGQWIISPELLWRLVTIHEATHLHHLYPKRQPPYLPTPLLDYLIDSHAIQSGLASSWLIKIIHEIEGKANEQEDPSDLYGPLTAEEAFIVNPNKIRTLNLDRDTVNQVMAIFDRLVEPEKQKQSNRFSQFEAAKVRFPQWLWKKLLELAHRHLARQADIDSDENY